MEIPIYLLERMTTSGNVYLLRSDEGEGEPLVPCPACTADSVHGVHRGRRQGDLLQQEKQQVKATQIMCSKKDSQISRLYILKNSTREKIQ